MDKDAVKIINDLISIAVSTDDLDIEKKELSKSFSASNISFVGRDSMLRYFEGMQRLYLMNKEISDTLTLETFEDKIVGLVGSLRESDSKCEASNLKKCYEELLALENIEIEVLYELYGAKMNSDIAVLGDFIIYNYPLAKNFLLEKYPSIQERGFFFDNRKSDIYLGVRVSARESKKAGNIADGFVESFENVMNYMISDLNHRRSIGVFNFRGWKNTNRIVCSNSGIGMSLSNEINLPMPIEHPLFKDSSQGNDKIWSLITKKKQTEIEKRLLQAIEWIGKGVHDKDKSKALVQFVFAIEGMLQYNDKTIITPSIVSQLSDWLAFIIDDDQIERKRIAKYFKQTYGKRSAIVHGGTKSIDDDDLHLAFQISKLMVLTFLTKDPFCNMKTISELNEYITELKFK